jgi:hypothetical protein
VGDGAKRVTTSAVIHDPKEAQDGRIEYETPAVRTV